jgi:hypothetical protein
MTDKQKLKQIKNMIQHKDYSESDNNLDWLNQLETLLRNIEELIDEKKRRKKRSKKS